MRNRNLINKLIKAILSNFNSESSINAYVRILLLKSIILELLVMRQNYQ